MSAVRSFGDRLAGEFSAGRRLCAGIDPHATLLDNWGLADSAQGAEHFGRAVVAAAAGVAACVKPQVAFYERFGAAGYLALERVLADAREAGLLVIADVKRGDIGSSFGAYADAWLTPGSPLESDAMTAVAYQGFDSLGGAFDHLTQHGKGLFVLAATSNPEARDVQRAIRDDGATVAARMVSDADAWNAQHQTAPGEQNTSGTSEAYGEANRAPAVGSIGVVLGATLDLADFGIETAVSTSGDENGVPILPILAPGFGFQGAKLEDANAVFGDLARGLIPNESRSILRGGEAGLGDRVRGRAQAISAALRQIA